MKSGSGSKIFDSNNPPPPPPRPLMLVSMSTSWLLPKPTARWSSESNSLDVSRLCFLLFQIIPNLVRIFFWVSDNELLGKKCQFSNYRMNASWEFYVLADLSKLSGNAIQLLHNAKLYNIPNILINLRRLPISRKAVWK